MHSLQINLLTSQVEGEEIVNRNIVSNEHRFLFTDPTSFYKKLNFDTNPNLNLDLKSWQHLLHSPLIDQPNLFKLNENFTLISLEPYSNIEHQPISKSESVGRFSFQPLSRDGEDNLSSTKFTFCNQSNSNYNNENCHIYHIYHGEKQVRNLEFNLFVERDDILTQDSDTDGAVDFKTSKPVDDEETVLALLGLQIQHFTIFKLMKNIEPFLNKSFKSPTIKLLVRENEELIVLIKFKLFNSALAFYNKYHNQPNFLDKGSEEITYVLFVQELNVNFFNCENGMGKTKILGYQLPTCTWCLNQIDSSVTGLKHFDDNLDGCNVQFNTSSDTSCIVCSKRQMYYATITKASTEQNSNPVLVCEMCSFDSDLWVCHLCGHVGCGRYHAAHASAHASQNHHLLALELETGSVWDYYGDRYVHQVPLDTGNTDLPPPYQTDEPYEVQYRNSLYIRDKENIVELVDELHSRMYSYKEQVEDKQKEVEAVRSATDQQQQKVTQLANQILPLEAEANLLQKQLDTLNFKIQQVKNQKDKIWRHKIEEESTLLTSLLQNLIEVNKETKLVEQEYQDVSEQLRDLNYMLQMKNLINEEGNNPLNEAKGGKLELRK